MKNDRITELIDDYRKYVVLYKNGYTGGNSKEVNKAHKEINIVLNELISINEDIKLVDLLNDEDKWIQLCAATHLLEVEETKALKTLNIIKNENIQFLSLIAETTIDEWNEGNLKFRE